MPNTLKAIPIVGQWDGGPCFCCRRRDDGILGGYVQRYGNSRLVWSCLDHVHLARKALHMPAATFDLYERKAMLAAGAAGGQYLDSLDCTDLAQLTEEEFVTFTKTVIDTFGTVLAAELSSHEAPF